MTKREELGLYVKQKRTERGLTLKNVASLLSYRGIAPISNLEYGLQTLPVEKIHPLARVLGIDVEELLQKIKECEPDLYHKYMTLKKEILADHTSRLGGLRGEYALHHLPHQGAEMIEGKGPGSDNLSYGNLRRIAIARFNIYYVNLWKRIIRGGERFFPYSLSVPCR